MSALAPQVLSTWQPDEMQSGCSSSQILPVPLVPEPLGDPRLCSLSFSGMLPALAHSALTIPASLLFLEQLRHAPISEPLHLLLPLLGKPFPDRSTWLISSFTPSTLFKYYLLNEHPPHHTLPPEPAPSSLCIIYLPPALITFSSTI